MNEEKEIQKLFNYDIQEMYNYWRQCTMDLIEDGEEDRYFKADDIRARKEFTEYGELDKEITYEEMKELEDNFDKRYEGGYTSIEQEIANDILNQYKMKNYNINKLKDILEKYIGKENEKDLRRNLIDELKLEGIEIDNCYLDDNHYIDDEDGKELYFEKWIIEDTKEIYFILYVMDNVIDSICMDRKEDCETILEI